MRLPRLPRWAWVLIIGVAMWLVTAAVAIGTHNQIIVPETLLLGGFVVLARPEPSVVRAAVMGVVGLVGLSASRRRAGVPALATSIVVLLCWDPWLARAYGFALSVLASFGLLWWAGRWADVLARWLPRWCAESVAVPLVKAMAYLNNSRTAEPLRERTLRMVFSPAAELR